MNIAIIAITEHGFQTALRIRSSYEPVPALYILKTAVEKNFFAENLTGRVTLFSESLPKLTDVIFKQFDGLVFVMASGIVVRVIAPHIKDKYTDPAIVAVDDVGRFVISLLSGHEGGANILTHKIAAILRTDAVITTGTEAQKDIIIGIGCKKGIPSENVKESILHAIQKANIKFEQIRLLSTIDIKSNEQGLIQASEELGLPLRIVSRQEIATCVKSHSKSEFVNEKIGVWGVCEPAALIAGRKTKLILKKQKYPGVTIAVARENFMW